MRKALGKVAASISAANNYNEEQAEIVGYMLNTIVFELLKTVGLIALFAITGKLVPGLIAMVVMASTKPFAGGYHEDTQLKCFVSSAVILGAVVFLGTTNELSYTSIAIINFLTVFAMWHQVPVQDPNMPITKQEILDKNRRRALITAIIWFIIFILLRKYKNFINIGTWTLLIEALFLFKKKDKNNTEN